MLVVGGGLTGCAAAYELAPRGVDVLLVERARPEHRRRPGATPAASTCRSSSSRFWSVGEPWARTSAPARSRCSSTRSSGGGSSPAELGVDLEVTLTGGLLVADTETQLRGLERKAAIERARGLEVELLTAPSCARRALRLASDGRRPPVPARGQGEPAARGARARPRGRGARRAVGARGSSCGRSSRRAADSALETSGGAIECERIVDCAGAAAGEVAALVGVPLPVESWPMQAHVTEPVVPLRRAPRLLRRRAPDAEAGRGGIDPDRRRLAVADSATGTPGDQPRVAARQPPRRAARRAALAQVRLLRVWTGVCNGTPDHRPILGELEGVPGFFVAAFPYLGFTAAPLMGRLVADLSRGLAVPYDLAPFAAARFDVAASRGLAVEDDGLQLGHLLDGVARAFLADAAALQAAVGHQVGAPER